MANKTLGEILTRIRNAVRVKSVGVEVKRNRITKRLARIILQEGLITEVKETFSPYKKRIPSLFLHLKYSGVQRTSVITNLRQISRPSSRVYVNYKKIPKILGGLGLIILSTSQGLITNREARIRKTGGELVCSIWLLFSKLRQRFY